MFFSVLLSGTCAILRITAHCITVRGERPSSMYPHLVAWPQLTDWYLFCRACSTSWRALHKQHEEMMTADSSGQQSQRGRSSNILPFFTPHRSQGKWNNKVIVLIHLFIQKFRKKRKYKKFSDTHLEMACQKIHHLSYRCGKKDFEASDTELERRQEFSECFLIISFPNQVMNTEILWKLIKKNSRPRPPSEVLGMQIIKTATW